MSKKKAAPVPAEVNRYPDIRGRWRPFFDLLEQNGNAAEACRTLGLSYGTYENKIARDPPFRIAAARARRIATERLEAIAWQRATEGLSRPVYQRGEVVGEIREPSDQLLMFLLKANCPEKFGDKLEQAITHKVARVVLEVPAAGMLPPPEPKDG